MEQFLQLAVSNILDPVMNDALIERFCHNMNKKTSDNILGKKYYRVVNKPCSPTQVVATRPIPKGSIILESPAIVVGPRPSRVPVCIGCLQPVIVDVLSIQCPGCGAVVCDDGECARAPMHLAECEALQHAEYRREPIRKELIKDWISEFPKVGLVFTVLRVLFLPTDQLNVLFQKYYRGSTGHLVHHSNSSTLACHVTEFIIKVMKLKCFEAARVMEATKLTLKLLIPLKHFEDRYDIDVHRLAVSIHNTDLVFMNSSCFANIELVQNVRQPSVYYAQALKDIKAGECLTYMLNDTLQTMKCTFTRYQERSFQCMCDRCSDPTEMELHTGSLSCLKCQRNSLQCMVVPISPKKISETEWTCLNCGVKTPGSKYKKIYLSLKNKLDLAVQCNDISELLSFIKTNSGKNGILHAKHEFILSAKNAYCETLKTKFSEISVKRKQVLKHLKYFYTFSEDLRNAFGCINYDLHPAYLRSKVVRGLKITHDWFEDIKNKNKTMNTNMAMDLISKEIMEISASRSKVPMWYPLGIDTEVQFTSTLQNLQMHQIELQAYAQQQKKE